MTWGMDRAIIEDLKVSLDRADKLIAELEADKCRLDFFIAHCLRISSVHMDGTVLYRMQGFRGCNDFRIALDQLESKWKESNEG